MPRKKNINSQGKINNTGKTYQDSLLKLVQQNEFLNSMIDSISDIIFCKDTEGRYLGCNRAFAEHAGLSKDEIVSRTDFDIYPQEKAEFCHRNDKIVLEQNERRCNDVWISYPDGRRVLIETCKTPYYGPDGTLFGLIGVSRDITDRKKIEEQSQQIESRLQRMAAERIQELVQTNQELQHEINERKKSEEALKESQQKFSDIINFLPDATVVVDKDNKVIAWNRAIEKMTGVKKKDIIGQGDYAYTIPFYGKRRPHLLDLIDITDKELESKYKYVQRKGNTLYAETFAPALYGGKGALVWATGAPLFDVHGNRVGAIESIRDITARRRAEEKYRGIFENAVMGIFQSTPEGHIISANPAFARVLGYESPEDVVDTVTDIARQVFVRPELHAERLQLMNEEGSHQEKEVQCFKKDGSTVWVTIAGLAVHDSSGKVLYYEGAMMDITDRKLLENQLRQAQKMEAIGTLAGGIAHDFNNILSAVMGYAELALREPKISDLLRRYLEQIYKAGTRAGDLVKQILTFSRQSDENLYPLKISPIVKEVMKLLRASLPTTIEIHQKIQSYPDTVLANPTHIHQILMNLCMNAVHAMGARKGTLRVELAPVEITSHDVLIHHGLAPGMHIKLTVSDTGHGIDPGIKDKIFYPFFTTKKPGEGTGMGLPVVHGIVKRYGGTITVQSKVGEGTEFDVYFPLLMETEGKRQKEATVHIVGGEECILFVDDEEALVNLGEGMLTGLGYKVVGRTSSLEALEHFRARSDRFDLVITDMTMPNMTGIELAQELMLIRPDIPVILCTGFSELITSVTVKSLGIRELIMKPIVLNQIATSIRRVIDRKE
jgi:PAS domain S-box-containing protein